MPWAMRSLNIVLGRILGVEVHGVLVAGNLGKGDDVGLAHGLGEARLLADAKILEENALCRRRHAVALP